MGISLRFVFRVSEDGLNPNDKDGYIYIQRIENRKKTYRSLGLPKLKKEFWDDSRQRVKKNKDVDHETYNTKIETTLRETLNQGGLFTRTDELTDKRSFLNYTEKVLSGPKFELKHGTRLKYQSVVKKLKDYLQERGKSDLLFSELSVEFLDDLQTYMLKSGMFPNSVTNYLKILQSFVKRSMTDREVMNTNNPFFNFKFEKKVIKTKETLDQDEIRLLIETKVKDPRLEKVRKMFLFQFFTGGMRVSDLVTLRFRNLVNGKLTYQMMKTGHPMEFQLTTVLMDILSETIPLTIKKDEYRKNDFKGELDLRDRKMKYIQEIQKKEQGRRPSPIPPHSSHIRSLPDFLFLTETDFQSYHYIPSNVSFHVNSLSYSELITEGTDVTEYLSSRGYRMRKTNVTVIDGFFEKKKHLLQEYLEIIKKNILELRDTYYSDVTKELNRLGTNPSTKNDFVFKRLKEQDFVKVLNQDNLSLISDSLYRKINRSGIVYNRNLKELQKELGLTKTFKTHLPRTSFTNIMMLGKTSHRDISNTLGHSSISITDEYLKTGFQNPGVNDIIQKTSENFEL
jgi:site-specific recombinase XerD